MGYILMTAPNGETEFLGDEVDREIMKRREGLPTIGRPEGKLKAIDKAGE